MRLLTLTAALAATLSLFAEHLPGGNIAVRCVSGNQHEITLRLWRECSGAPMIEQALTLVNSCGVSFTLNNVPLIATSNVSPVCADQLDQTTCNGGTLIGIEEYVYRTTVFLSPCNFWRIYWSTCCRLPALNTQGSQGIYIEALVNNQGGACNALPSFADAAPPVVCMGQPVSYDPGVLFTQGQQLRFRLINARRLINPDPQNLDIQSITYQAPFTGTEPYTGMAIDSLTGQITFTPAVQGYIVCAMAVETRVGGVWRGTIMRDFPFIVQACSNQVPDAASGTVGNLQGPGGTTGAYALTACGPLCFDVTVADPDAGQTLTLSSNVTSAIPGASISYAGTNPVVATVCMPGTLANGTYLFTIAALDDACPVRGSQTYTYVVTRSASTVNAGADATASLCPGGTVDLSTLVTGDAGGSWSAGPVVSEPGTYTYTVSGSCGQDEAVFTVTPGTAPDAGGDAQVSVCAGDDVDLSAYLTGDAGGSWSPAGPLVSAPGIYTYTVTNGCGSDAATIVVSAVEPPDAGLSAAITVCPQAAPFQMIDSLQGSPAFGGTWTLGGAPHAPIFNPGSDGEGVFCYTVPASLPCPSATACLTITLLDAQSPDCISLGVPAGSNTFRFYPNPSNGTLQIDAPGALRAEVLDAAGRTAWSIGLNGSGSGILALPASLGNGSYALRVIHADGAVSAHRFELVR